MRLIFLFLGNLCCLFILSSCSSVNSVHEFDHQQAAIWLQSHQTLQPAKQRIAIALPNKKYWQRLDMSRGTIGSPIMLIPANETEQHWTQSIRTYIVSYTRHPRISLSASMDIIRNETAETCTPIQFHIIEQTNAKIFYQTTCGDEIQIGKGFKGSDADYFVYYTAQKNQVSEYQISRMRQVISHATLSAATSTPG